jgi:hypothetical protein
MVLSPDGRALARLPFRTLLFTLLSYLMVALIALLPRLLDLGRFVTVDEAHFWIERSNSFLRAVQRGDFAATAITGHPGVTTMWLGSAGIVLHRLLEGWGWIDGAFATRLALLQAPIALMNAAGVLVGYWLLRRLFQVPVALLAALLWATDPFVVGFSRLLHVDGLAATFTALSLLAACVYWQHTPRGGILILSGVCGALAALSKTPALALLPVVAGVALFADRAESSRRANVAALVGWGGVFLATLMLLWPALWAVPARVYELVRVGVEIEGGSPHASGNFFLGRPDEAPGLLFYPVALALRTTPWSLLGLLLLPFALRPLSMPSHRTIITLVGFALLFIIAMSLFPKKHNRYLVLIFPLINVLAAVGLVAVAQFLPRLQQGLGVRSQESGVRSQKTNVTPAGIAAPPYLGHRNNECNPRVKALIAGVTLMALINAAVWHPYGITAFNQALGGSQVGANTFLIGWGEGLEQVADWLNEQPDITGVSTASTITAPLQRYLRPGAQSVTPLDDELSEQIGYVVVYARNVQGGPPPPPFDEFYEQQEPAHVVYIHDVPYAWIYQMPPMVRWLAPAYFGSTLFLRGFDRDEQTNNRAVVLTLFWHTLSTPPMDYTLFAHLIGDDGQRYAQIDLPYPTSTWGSDRYVQTELRLTIPQNVPPGTYQLSIGLYEPDSGERLSVGAIESIDPSLNGPNAFPLTRVRVE